MATEREERVRVERAGDFERKQRVVEYAPSMQVVLVSRISQLLWLMAGIVDGLLVFRFILKLVAADPGSGFANFVYSLTNVLVAPFGGIISLPPAQNGSIIDFAALFAILVYTVVAVVVIQLLRILFASAGGTKQVTTIERRS